MKLKLIMALAAIMFAAPVVQAAASAEEIAEQKEAAKKAKAKKAAIAKIKNVPFFKLKDAKPIAEAAERPILLIMLPDSKEMQKKLADFDKKVLKRKEFIQVFAKQNLVVLQMKLKPSRKDPKKVDRSRMTDDEIALLNNFGVSATAVAQAKALNKDEPKPEDMSNFPAVVCIDSMCQKEYFRMPRFDVSAGFGVWLSQLVDFMRAKAGVEELVIDQKLIQPILDDPTGDGDKK